MTTTYTVFDPQDTQNHRSGLSMESAAVTLLNEDGYEYEIRKDKKFNLLVLFISDGSRNSPRGARHLIETRFRGETEDEIYEAVIGDEWHGMECMTDADFAAMVARFDDE